MCGEDEESEFNKIGNLKIFEVRTIPRGFSIKYDGRNGDDNNNYS
jgi:hypothetical protein